MSSIDKFKITLTNIDIYFPMFIVNTFERKLFTLTLKDDTQYTGIPTAIYEFHGALTKPYFHFSYNNELYSIHFEQIKSAVPFTTTDNKQKFKWISEDT
jgi:hypothetical protein